MSKFFDLKLLKLIREIILIVRVHDIDNCMPPTPLVSKDRHPSSRKLVV